MAAWTDRSGTITTGGTAQTICAVNASRKAFYFENLANENLFINFTTAAVTSQPSIRVRPGVGILFDVFVSTELVSVIGATTGSAFMAKEA